MNRSSNRQYLLKLSAVIALLVVFALDLQTELGVASPIAYIVVVWLAYMAGSNRGVFIAAAVASVLTLLGMAFSPVGGDVWKVLANRSLALLVIWFAASVLVRLQQLLLEQRKKADVAEFEAVHLKRQHDEDRRLSRAMANIMEDLQIERDKLGKSQDQLRERTAELAKLNESLLYSNEELEQFAYVASHDLKTPLRAISGFAQCLQEDYKGRLDEQADDYILRVVEGVNRMQQLINDLLDFSRVESQGNPFRRIRLNEAIKDALSLLQADIDDTGAEVTFDDLPTAIADRTQITQLFQNLIGNALKYHGDQPPRVHVSVQRNDDQWTIAVSDNGIGIAPEHHDRVFEIFRRLHTQQAYAGTGIGLAVCRRIVQRHGGRLWLESVPGEGSKFYFTIDTHEQQIDVPRRVLQPVTA